MTITEIVKKLIGPIDPIGRSEVDEKYFKNLKQMCDLVLDLTQEINFVSRSKISHEGSVKAAGEYADNFIKNLPENI